MGDDGCDRIFMLDQLNLKMLDMGFLSKLGTLIVQVTVLKFVASPAVFEMEKESQTEADE